MPTNQQRREAAKRKLERQLERRAQKARKRKQLTIAGSVLGVVVVLAAGALVYVLTKGEDSSEPAASSTDGSCTYIESGQPGARDVQMPPADGAEELTEPVAVKIDTNQGPIGLSLDPTKSPCTVNNFVSLASQNFFDNTPCHRLTADDALKVLQCGDPSGTGMGGPGYMFANEYPTPRADGEFVPENVYTRGTLAMANSGADTNGSQFFLVYGDSKLPPDYTIFGAIDETGLATLDKIAAGGITPSERGPLDGAPTQPVDILSVTPA